MHCLPVNLGNKNFSYEMTVAVTNRVVTKTELLRNEKKEY
jgi:hypothetical protein